MTKKRYLPTFYDFVNNFLSSLGNGFFNCSLGRLSHGILAQEASNRAASSFGQGKPVCMPKLPKTTESVWHGGKYEPQ
jgi:hypothetical protein